MLKDDVIEFFGSPVQTAEALGITRGAVHLWPRLVPERAALLVEKMTNGLLKYDPTLYGREWEGERHVHKTGTGAHRTDDGTPE